MYKYNRRLTRIIINILRHTEKMKYNLCYSPPGELAPPVRGLELPIHYERSIIKKRILYRNQLFFVFFFQIIGSSFELTDLKVGIALI